MKYETKMKIAIFSVWGIGVAMVTIDSGVLTALGVVLMITPLHYDVKEIAKKLNHKCFY